MIVRSAKSAPAQKCSPWPARTTTRTSGSAPSSPNAFVSSCSMAMEMALRCSGRSSVTVATCPSRSTRTDGLLNDSDDVALLDDAALLDTDLRDRPCQRGFHGDLHLHRLEDHERIALCDGVALGDDDLPHVRDHLGEDLGHLYAPEPPDSTALRSGSAGRDSSARASAGSATSRPCIRTIVAAASTRFPFEDAISPLGR